ncbi:hypothetical protein R1sor_026235 [Riccia sorocarpa]|uniref:Uncharacterized protein n=1 Tax=Riccia sorocarpa TaxID=122646 RepID=A0ABD3GCJ0_9MARC
MKSDIPKAKTEVLGIVYSVYADNDKLNVGVEDRKAKKLYRIMLDLNALDQTMILRTDQKLTMSAHGFFVHLKSNIHDWVNAIRGMREALLRKNQSESNVWKLAWACDKQQVTPDQVGTITSKHIFVAAGINWEEWVADRVISLKSKSSSKASNTSKQPKALKLSDPGSLPSTSRSEQTQGLHLTDELVRPISVVDPDDDFPDEPSQLLLGSSNRDLLGPAPKTKPKRKKTPDVDIRDNILLSEEEAIQENIDPKDDEQIKIEAEKIKKFYVMNCQEVMISIWRLTDPISDFVHRLVIQSYVLELEKLMKGSVKTPSAATVIPYILEEDAKRRFVNLNTIDDVVAHSFKEMVSQTFNTPIGNIGDVLWICCAPEDIFQKWVDVCNAWINEALKAEDATVKKILTYYAEKYKATDLTREILDSEFGLNFDAIAKLSKLKLKKPPKSSSKKGSKEPSAKRVKGDDGSTEDRTFENRLQYIWITTRGTACEKTENPWVIAPYRMNLVYDDNELPRLGQVSLVFVDLARNLQFEATKTLFETIMLTAIGMTICSPILFTFVLFPETGRAYLSGCCQIRIGWLGD